MINENVINDVCAERARQDAQWGNQSEHNDFVWNAILTEEIGEVSQAVLHQKFGGPAKNTLYEELTQVAAVAIAWMEAINKRGENPE